MPNNPEIPMTNNIAFPNITIALDAAKPPIKNKAKAAKTVGLN